MVITNTFVCLKVMNQNQAGPQLSKASVGFVRLPIATSCDFFIAALGLSLVLYRHKNIGVLCCALFLPIKMSVTSSNCVYF